MLEYELMEKKKKEVSEWLNHHFIEWITSTGERHTVTEYAEYLGVSRSLLSRYLSGKILPSESNVYRIADVLGNEIYDIMEIPKPDPLLRYINRQWDYLTPEEQKQIMELLDSFTAQEERKRADEQAEATT